MMMNKKGQADIVGNIISFIPKPVLFLIFIMLMGVIVILLSPMFNSFGVFCDSTGTIVKLHESNFITNIAVLRSIPDAKEIAGDNINPNKFLLKCTEWINGSQYLSTYGCSTCEFGEIPSQVDARFDVCDGDAFRTPDNELSWWGENIKCPVADCRIPKGYYFEFDSGEYECIGDCSSQTLANVRDFRLDELGAVPMYEDNLYDNSASSFMKFGCSDALRVEPTVKGIPIFRLEYWLMMILISLLIWGISKFGKK